MSNLLKKTSLFSATLFASTFALAQVQNSLPVQKQELKQIVTERNAKVALQRVPQAAYKNASAERNIKAVPVNPLAEKPGTYYTVNSGVYNLVPGFMLGQDNNGGEYYSGCGILGYIDRDITFKNQTKSYDSAVWTLYGQEFTDDSLTIHPFFPTSGVSAETPVLTATLNGVDSVYQMGNYIDGYDQSQKGMIALTGGAFVYNVDVFAQPYVNTFYSTTNPQDPWNNILFGNDAEYKPFYMEIFDAPAGGAVLLNATHFSIATPIENDLANKSFGVAWWELNPETQQWDVRKEFTIKASEYYDYENIDLRLWDFFAIDEELDVMVNNSFAIVINGPQDGTRWALMHQIDRMDFPTEDVNTAFFVPTQGSNEGIPCQYQIGYVENGQIQSFFYNTSLDIHQFVVAPYILLCKDDASMSIYNTNKLDMDVNGEERSFVLSDWYGAPSTGVTIQAAVKEGGDWLTITQPSPSLDGYTFKFTVKASSKDFLIEGRKAVVTLTDNHGFSRDIIFYQGDRGAADVPNSIDDIENAKDFQVISTSDAFQVACPEGTQKLQVLRVDGTVVAEYAAQGSEMISVAKSSMAKGIYLFQAVGSGQVKTVKVLR